MHVTYLRWLGLTFGSISFAGKRSSIWTSWDIRARYYGAQQHAASVCDCHTLSAVFDHNERRYALKGHDGNAARARCLYLKEHQLVYTYLYPHLTNVMKGMLLRLLLLSTRCPVMYCFASDSLISSCVPELQCMQLSWAAFCGALVLVLLRPALYYKCHPTSAPSLATPWLVSRTPLYSWLHKIPTPTWLLVPVLIPASTQHSISLDFLATNI